MASDVQCSDRKTAEIIPRSLREQPFDDLPFRVTRVLTTGRLQWHSEEAVEHDIG